MVALGAVVGAGGMLASVGVAVPSTGLAESSGLAVSAYRSDVVWVVEDTGDPVVHAMTGDGSAAGSITLDGWNNRDTEALAPGLDGTLWIADIGDNRGVRDSVVVHVVDEPEGAADVVVAPTSYRFTYPDGPRDAETFLVDPLTGRAYVISKTLQDPQVYALPADLVPGQTHDVVPVASAPALITDGAFAPDGERLVLRGYFAAFSYVVERDADGVLSGLGPPATLDLPAQGQGESLAITRDGATVLIGSEGPEEPIYAVPLPAPTGEPGSDESDVAAQPTGPASAASETASPAPDIADGVKRELDGPVGTTLIAMAGLAAVGTVGWLTWFRVHRARSGRRRPHKER